MAQRNRVDPHGALIETSARGLFMGNRGILHDAAGRLTKRRWTSRAWIICLLAYKGWHREILQPNTYTELFFLDEATALAAGHRPCALCQRDRFNAFRAAWPAGGAARAPEIDRCLHAERLTAARTKRTHPMTFGALPEGTMIVHPAAPEQAALVARGRLFAWCPDGYAALPTLAPQCAVDVLSPPATVSVLRAGYRPVLHPSLYRL